MRLLSLLLLLLLVPRQAAAVCGDGVLDGSDVCDDGNTSGSDMCSADCTAFTFISAGTHPDASTNASTTGKWIRKLVPYKFKLYPAYGDEDYDSNAGTGPTNITPYNPATDTFPNEDTQESEAIDDIIIMADKLFLPNIDYHHTSGSPTDVETTAAYMVESGGAWTTGTVGTAYVHAYSMVRLGGDLFIAGAAGGIPTDGVVQVSTDGGSNWSTSLTIGPEDANTNARFYFIGKLGSNLYAQAYDITGDNLHTNSEVYNGSSWSSGTQLSPDLAFGQHPVEFGSYMIYKGAGNTLRKFDGTTDSLARTAVYDYTVHQGTLYALETDNEIYTSSDADSFTLFAAGPSNSRSLGILNNRLYVGDTVGEIFVTEILLRCGDLTIDGGETCDFTSLNSATCVSQGYASGTLACANNCGSYDETACSRGGLSGATLN